MRPFKPIPPRTPDCPDWKELAPGRRHVPAETEAEREIFHNFLRRSPLPKLIDYAKELDIPYQTMANRSAAHRWAERTFLYWKECAENTRASAVFRRMRLFDLASDKLESVLSNADVDHLSTLASITKDTFQSVGGISAFLDGPVKQHPSVSKFATLAFGLITKLIIAAPESDRPALLNELSEMEKLLAHPLNPITAGELVDQEGD